VRALEVDFLGEGGPIQKADTRFYLSKKAFKRQAHDELWRGKAATSAKSLGMVGAAGERAARPDLDAVIVAAGRFLTSPDIGFRAPVTGRLVSS
jgi:hypothetical protein